MSTTAVPVELFFTGWMEINESWINKIVLLHPTDETVPTQHVYQLVRVERKIGAGMVHGCKNFRLSILSCTCLVTSTMLGTSIGMP